MKKDNLNINIKKLNLKCNKKFLIIAPLFVLTTLMTLSLILLEYFNFVNPYVVDNASQLSFINLLLSTTYTFNDLFVMPLRYVGHYVTLALIVFAIITFISQIPLAVLLGDYTKETFKKFYNSIIKGLLKYFQVIICKGIKGTFACIFKGIEALITALFGALSIVGIIFAIIPLAIGVIAILLSVAIFLGMCVLILIPLILFALFFAITGIQVFNAISFYEYCSWEQIRGNLSIELSPIEDKTLLEPIDETLLLTD